jgi:hypothetical protein
MGHHQFRLNSSKCLVITHQQLTVESRLGQSFSHGPWSTQLEISKSFAGQQTEHHRLSQRVGHYRPVQLEDFQVSSQVNAVALENVYVP